EHIALAQSADVVVIAPASANTIAKIACGIADNMLCSTVLATRAPIIVAPAMNVNMWENPATRENTEKLRRRGFDIVGPAHGWLAEGRKGWGRMVEPPEVIDAIKIALGRGGDLAGKRIVVTSGGTQEPIDPVRHITNRSSGRMGCALAEAARDRGAEVTLVAAPMAVPDPNGMKTVHVCTAEEMFLAVKEAVSGCDALVMAAAVADYRPEKAATEKIKKSGAKLTLTLAPTRDILASLSGSFVKVGFAAESQDLIANARKKLESKGLDLIVANDISRCDAGFASDMNQVTLLDRGGKAEEVPLLPKSQVADRILDRVVALLARPARGPE
ncbi:MAG: bifunctional phosphopantothenoylcysteine decarboxylase/phosphopantothenate--cysteine ligase CoaBC, partial [Chloroflexi bacterium]|nr:bifunctional phosphopantothenoylcysteine decarboxylase/phosphopantothenate--cysteine ligase CoaBC [Chloroflexota bacterium]